MTDQSQLTIRAQPGGKAALLCVAGRLDGTNASRIEAAVDERLGAKEALLLFDLTELIYISSAGLRQLLIVARKLQANGGKALFCGLSDEIFQVFEVSGFKDVLSVHRSREDALAAAGLS